MATVQIEQKTFEMKRTLKVKEFGRLMDRMKFIVNFPEKVKNATPEELQVLTNQINELTSDDWVFVKETIKSCYQISDDELGEILNTDMLLMFDELRKESSQLKKK